MTHNAETLAFVRQYRDGDVRQLALQAARHPLVDMPWALDQIRGWQTAKDKLPSWAACDGIVYPPHLSMEQCSSEAAARYKQQLVKRLLRRADGAGKACGTNADAAATTPPRQTLVDLTGGFGVDFSFLAPLFAEATYVERLPHLCEAARHNFQLLGLNAVTVKNDDSIEVLQSLDHATVIFVDPARRDTHGRKTYSIKDCTPDVAQLCPLLLGKCDYLVLKLSPMLDWHEAVRELSGVMEVHIVSVANECKELLLVLSAAGEQPLRVVCVNDDQRFEYEPAQTNQANQVNQINRINPTSPISPIPPTVSSLPTSHFTLHTSHSLFLPNASIMKAGCFTELAAAFRLQALSANSHLFVSVDETAEFEGFPGRVFHIEAVTTMNKKELRQALADVPRANVAVRNFPLTADQLRKRLKLKDGGDTYIFGTTVGKAEHILIIAKKVR